MPLIEDKPFAQSLDMETGYRYSSYNLGFKTNTYKFGVDWSPVHDVRLRGSFARAVRAPNVVELFTPQAIGLDGTYSSDPCAGAAPAVSAAAVRADRRHCGAVRTCGVKPGRSVQWIAQRQHHS